MSILTNTGAGPHGPRLDSQTRTSMDGLPQQSLPQHPKAVFSTAPTTMFTSIYTQEPLCRDVSHLYIFEDLICIDQLAEVLASTASTPNGPWSTPIVIYQGNNLFYAPVAKPHFDTTGKTLIFDMSIFSPLYLVTVKVVSHPKAYLTTCI